MARNDPAYLLRFPSKALRTRLRAEAKARQWSLQTYIIHLVATHHERVKRTNNEEGA